MTKQIIAVLLLIGWSANLQAQNSRKLPERYYQLIEAPTNPGQWNAWRQTLRTWRDSTLKSLH